MYKKGIYKILANEPLTASVWRMVLEGDTEWIVRPGQFVNIALEGRYLRRPISVCDCDARTLTLIYKVVGGGTEQMSRMAAGAELDLLTGLGNGFVDYTNKEITASFKDLSPVAVIAKVDTSADNAIGTSPQTGRFPVSVLWIGAAVILGATGVIVFRKRKEK